MGDAGDEEASETVADLPRFEADAEAVREADLRAAAAATAARDGVPRDGVPRLGNGKPRITTTAPWAMGAGRPAPPARQRRTAAPWAPPAPGKPGTSPTKQSAVGLGSMPTMGKSLPPHQCATTTTAPPPPPPQAFLDSCPGLSDRHSSLRVEAMTYGSLFGGVDTAVRRDGCPPCPVVVPVFQRTYCWTDEQVAGWWRDAFMGGEKEGDAKPKPAADRLAHGTGRCLFRRVMTEGDGGDGSGSSGSQSVNQSLLCLDGQQRSTTTQLALAAVRDAALGLDDDALVRRIEDALWETGDDVLEWIQAAAKTQTNTGGDSGLTLDSSPYVEGARPPFRSRFVPSWVDRAPFLECIAAGAVHHAAGTPLTYSPATLSTFMGRAKLLLDAKAAELVDLHDRTRSIERLVAAVDAALVGTKLIYIEVKGDDVDLAQAFQWLQEKSLFAGSILWNPTPGVDFAACDLVRNALVSTTLSLPLREQEARYVAMWLDPLQRRVKDGGSPAAFDALLNAFLDAEDARREKWAKEERGASETSAKGAAIAALRAASTRASALAADGVPVGPRYVSATERDLGAMMASDAVPEKFKKGAGPGSPMWVYCRFRSYVEEVALGVSGVDPGTRKAKKRGKPRNFDMTTSAPPPEEEEEEEEEEQEKVSGISDGDGLWGGVDGARDEGEDGGDAVPITDEVTRVVLARVVEFAEGNGHFE